MIRRKLNENDNLIINRLIESYNKISTFSNKDLTNLYSTLFEDVKSVDTVFIHPKFDQEFDWWYGEDLFEEVNFPDGTHYFLTEVYDGKLKIEEVHIPDYMLEKKEYL